MGLLDLNSDDLRSHKKSKPSKAAENAFGTVKRKRKAPYIVRGFTGEPTRKTSVPRRYVPKSQTGHSIFMNPADGKSANKEMLARHATARQKLAEERAFREKKKQAAIKVRTTHFKKLGKSNRKNLKKAWNKIW